MNTPHNASEMAKLIQELRQHISKDQTELHMAEPKFKRLEQEILNAKAELAKMEAEATHEKAHMDEIKHNLMETEKESREIQMELQKANLAAKH